MKDLKAGKLQMVGLFVLFLTFNRNIF